MTTLVFPYHDPDGSLHSKLISQLPNLKTIFDQIITHVSASTHYDSIEFLEKHCEKVAIDTKATDLINQIGKIRRQLLEFAIDYRCDDIMYCDWDRILYWSENHFDELKSCVRNVKTSDFTIFGRTNRAWISHPATQHRTESIINDLFAMKTDLHYDLLAACRGISYKAAKVITNHSTDDTFGVDVSWPLLILANSGLSLSYVRVDGLSFETGEVEQDIDEWIHRIKVVLTELESIKDG